MIYDFIPLNFNLPLATISAKIIAAVIAELSSEEILNVDQ